MRTKKNSNIFHKSVSRFGRQLSKEDLETAYGRAGRSFNGQLQQNFVVLNERDQDLLQSVTQQKSGPSGSSVTRSHYTGSGSRGVASVRGKGIKRSGEEIDPSNSKK
jgi:hypothetical protein